MSTPKVVIDASLLLAAQLNEPLNQQASDEIQQILASGGYTTGIFKLEIANTFATLERAKKLKHTVDQLIASAWEIPLTTDGQTDERAWKRTLVLARRHGLSTYDATYLELAIRADAALATLDRPLAAAAKREGVIVLPAALNPSSNP